MSEIGRRDFLKSTAAAALGLGLAGICPFFGNGSARADDGDGKTIPKRMLGKTGFNVSILGLGGEWLIERREQREEAVAVINRAIDLGVNYLDTSQMYGFGGSETNLGEVLKDRRKEVFIASKTRDRHDNTEAALRFEQSCERLQTDVIDLYMFHMVDMETELHMMLNRETGAIRLFERMRDKGRIKAIGIAGHTTSLFIKALEKYDFDCIVTPINPAGIFLREPEKLNVLLALAKEKNVGVIAMKVAGRGRLLQKDINMEQAMSYALSFPVSTAIIGISNMDELEENARAARNFRQYSVEERKKIEEAMKG